MTHADIIQSILRDSNYNLTLFAADEIEALRDRVVTKEPRGKETAFVRCIVRDMHHTFDTHYALNMIPLFKS